MSPESYDSWLAALETGKSNPKVRVVILTGKGSYFTAGQELALPVLKDGESILDYFTRRVAISKSLVDTLITYPKLLIHAVNGPALGFGVTSTALADLVYAVPESTFKTPFMDLALCVEACSTVTFPKALGAAKAKDMLFMGRQMTAQEWESAGLITEILPRDAFMESVMERAVKAASYAPDAVIASLALVKDVDREVLLKMNQKEMELLIVRLMSKEFQSVVAKFMSKKNKL